MCHTEYSLSLKTTISTTARTKLVVIEQSSRNDSVPIELLSERASVLGGASRFVNAVTLVNSIRIIV